MSNSCFSVLVLLLILLPFHDAELVAERTFAFPVKPVRIPEPEERVLTIPALKERIYRSKTDDEFLKELSPFFDISVIQDTFDNVTTELTLNPPVGDRYFVHAALCREDKTSWFHLGLKFEFLNKVLVTSIHDNQTLPLSFGEVTPGSLITFDEYETRYPSCQSSKPISSLAEMRKEIQESFYEAQIAQPLEMLENVRKFNISLIPELQQDVDVLLANDRAWQVARNLGRNRYYIFGIDDDIKLLLKTQLASESPFVFETDMNIMFNPNLVTYEVAKMLNLEDILVPSTGFYMGKEYFVLSKFVPFISSEAAKDNSQDTEQLRDLRELVYFCQYHSLPLTWTSLIKIALPEYLDESAELHSAAVVALKVMRSLPKRTAEKVSLLTALMDAGDLNGGNYLLYYNEKVKSVDIKMIDYDNWHKSMRQPPSSMLFEGAPAFHQSFDDIPKLLTQLESVNEKEVLQKLGVVSHRAYAQLFTLQLKFAKESLNRYPDVPIIDFPTVVLHKAIAETSIKLTKLFVE